MKQTVQELQLPGYRADTVAVTSLRQELVMVLRCTDEACLGPIMCIKHWVEGSEYGRNKLQYTILWFASRMKNYCDTVNTPCPEKKEASNFSDISLAFLN